MSMSDVRVRIPLVRFEFDAPTGVSFDELQADLREFVELADLLVYLSEPVFDYALTRYVEGSTSSSLRLRSVRYGSPLSIDAEIVGDILLVAKCAGAIIGLMYAYAKVRTEWYSGNLKRAEARAKELENAGLVARKEDTNAMFRQAIDSMPSDSVLDADIQLRLRALLDPPLGNKAVARSGSRLVKRRSALTRIFFKADTERSVSIAVVNDQ
ncbi:hypothetical protein [Curtobacterium sp. MCLR17_044]|uniref:hypothetical protein n=1 Tax=Curtobacterium sp. MCLR17_044 TaxID=2175628 RepID=UPI0011B60250|nr:hypothetical protein [Curtobacterium sp. MCLR17_044]